MINRIILLLFLLFTFDLSYAAGTDNFSAGSGVQLKNNYFKQKKNTKKYQKLLKNFHNKYTSEAKSLALHDYVDFQNNIAKQMKNMKNIVNSFAGIHPTKKSVQYYNNFFRNTDRLYIFISSSIPISTLRNYAQIVSILKNKNIYFVMRGCVDSCHTIAPTKAFIHQIIALNKKGNKVLPIIHGIQIDPLLFRLYNIKRVPVFVYAKNVNPLNITRSQGWLKNLSGTPVFYKSAGDWSFKYHIEQLADMSRSQELADLYHQLNQNWYTR